MTDTKTLMARSTPDTSPTVSLNDPRNITAATTALTSLLVWALTRYAGAPAEVSAAVAVVVPAAVAWVGAHFAFKTSPPRTETPITAPAAPVAPEAGGAV